MKPGDTTKLRREVKATAIPSGSPLSLPAETEVTLTQSLGGSHTVAGSFGLASFRTGVTNCYVGNRSGLCTFFITGRFQSCRSQANWY